LLFFVGGLVFAVVAGLDPAGARKPAIVLMLAFVAATGAYAWTLSRHVPDLAAYGTDEKRTLWRQVDALEPHPLSAIIDADGMHDLLTRTMPDTTVNVLGIPSLALVALRAPATAAILALGIVPLALMYASGAGFLVLQLVSAPSVVK